MQNRITSAHLPLIQHSNLDGRHEFDPDMFVHVMKMYLLNVTPVNNKFSMHTLGPKYFYNILAFVG